MTSNGVQVSQEAGALWSARPLPDYRGIPYPGPALHWS